LPLKRRALQGRQRILVIKLGALGDFVQAMGPAAAIRAYHPDASITLLTTKPYAELARAAPYFDDVWIDVRPGRFDLGGWLRLRHRLRGGKFNRVYDLQTSTRSSGYFRLIGPGQRPEWSGIALGASHPHANPQRDFMHTLDRQAEQLAMAGIPAVPAPDLSWATLPEAGGDIARFSLVLPIVLLVPGGAVHRPEKRWPAGRYAQIAALIVKHGGIPVVIGGEDEREAGREIARSAPSTRDLTGQTSFADIVALGGVATYAIGNDTGPMHLIVAAGCPATVLYSAASDPALTRPRGAGGVTVLRRADLGTLGVEEVAATLPFG
jgi:ADP-heptose:LPS heptosyltransferase